MGICFTQLALQLLVARTMAENGLLDPGAVSATSARKDEARGCEGGELAFERAGERAPHAPTDLHSEAGAPAPSRHF